MNLLLDTHALPWIKSALMQCRWKQRLQSYRQSLPNSWLTAKAGWIWSEIATLIAERYYPLLRDLLDELRDHIDRIGIVIYP